MINIIRSLPPVFAVFGGSVMFSQVPDIPAGTAAGALIAGFTLVLATLVWIVKRQLETFPGALKDQQDAFTASLGLIQKTHSDAMDKQSMVFAAVFDKVREDNQKTLKMFKDSISKGGSEN